MVNHFKKKWLLHALCSLLVYTNGYTQNYYPLQGSNYAGSLGIGNNPASIVNSPYQWDVAILGIQKKNATNSVIFNNWSFFSDPRNAHYRFREGDFKRFAYDDLNVNLLNTRIGINRRQAIGFGLNLRSYVQGSTGPINFVDTLKSTRDFFDLGNYNRNLHGDVTHAGWIEFFITWAQTIWDNPDSRLNAGITAKVSRGISGAYVNVLNGSATQTVHNNTSDYTLQDVFAEYEYSNNYDGWQKEKGSKQNLRDFLSHSQGGFSFDLGVEYLVKSQQITTVWDDDTYYDYDWKFGASLLDVGFNQFKYGTNSRKMSGFLDNITDTVIDIRFDDINKLQEFNNELPGIVRSIKQPTGTFHIVNPTRLVLNVDHFITGAWYINGNASLNLSSFTGVQRRLTELNMLTLTPRWETKKLGFFLPIQFNTKKQLWIGGAVKLGPLLLGLHNWANVFSKTKMQNGGGYLALILRPGRNTGERPDKRLDCPPGR
ncbi:MULTISPECIES: hypothetical protein [Niastella]|uniref:DUF5723 domain-containing protein n=1 Tax=Niastella soli TaxID=2821487 RepID=A0ABS3YMD5_9BACT|nr:hypothetical protein [Niastella soli]MBO9198988.1 hypothetical protein [Niastella soli]